MASVFLSFRGRSADAASAKGETKADVVRVACVGDSITFGSGVENRAKNNYPAVLNALLGPGYQVKNFGVSGATLLKKGNKPYWKLVQFRAADDFAPDIVVIALGTNDSKPMNWEHKEEFAGDLKEMIEHFRGLRSKSHVMVCLPPPVFQKDEDGINERTVKEEIIPVIRKIAEASGAGIIDLHEALIKHREFLPDGVHPNAAGAKIVAETVHAALSKEKKGAR